MKSQNEMVFNPDTWQQIRSSRTVRLAIATKSLYHFAHIYFGEFIRYPTAPFQKQIYKDLADPKKPFLVTVAFRGSGKSTIATLIYPLWSLLGSPGKKCIVLISLNQSQARTLLQHIKRQVEGNELLRKDFGPLEEDSDEWGAMSLVFPKYNARIVAVSSDQSIRGIRHGAYRPGLIIADDVEDLNSVRTMEGRNKTAEWFNGEVVPLGDTDTKIVVIGNKLHEDSLMMRLKERPNVVYREYPLIDEQGRCLWKAKFPDKAAIEKEHVKVGNEIAWKREYLLVILPNEDQVIDPAWISYYVDLPTAESKAYEQKGIGVDLAISQREAADYTAMVVAEIHWQSNEDFYIYIYPRPFNSKPTHLETIEAIQNLYASHGRPNLYIESNSYQRSVIEQLQVRGIRAEGIQTTIDKRSKLISISHLIQSRRILFANRGCEELITQIVGFGKEKHDDLVDAFTLVVNQLLLSYKRYGLIAYYKQRISA